MATSNLPTPSLQPIATLTNATDDKDAVELLDEGASCCGGGCCSSN
ncbi:hypothetical protein [Microbacterium sp. MM2322]